MQTLQFHTLYYIVVLAQLTCLRHVFILIDEPSNKSLNHE